MNTRTNAVIDTSTGQVVAGPFAPGKRGPAMTACRALNATTVNALGNYPKRLRYRVKPVAVVEKL